MKLYDDAEVFISEMYEFEPFFSLGYMYCKETFQNYNMKKKKKKLGLVVDKFRLNGGEKNWNLNPFCLSL